MNTQILEPTTVNILRCASRLKTGALVAFPTETVYALGAVATDEQAVKKVYEVKRRPLDKPLIVAVAKKSEIDTVAVNIPDKARLLIDKFMPGALTLLLDRAPCIPDIVTAGSDTVAVRIPDNEIAIKLIELTGKPVVVPSANTADKASSTLAAHVKEDLDGKIEFILDGGQSEIGIESTIIDVRTEPPTVIRGGGTSLAAIEAVIGKMQVKREKPAVRLPEIEVLFSAYYEGMTGTICAKYDEIKAEGKRPVIMCLDGSKAAFGDRKTITVGKNYEEYAHNLFAALRSAESEHYDAVIAEGVKSEGIGASLIARLIKVSNGQII
ncbi:MAG: threonylcarbamoyl-AMP synthase [Clostridiales bacterium]|nr:threonylcarbamoyl-AMP synthase [Clostridiales bacterium]